MYCVKCGVELADSEKMCPLCKTPVYYPEGNNTAESTYPSYEPVKIKDGIKGVSFLVSIAHLIAATISVLCDYNVNREINWSDYVIGALLLSYLTFVLPSWFRRPSPAIFVPCDFLGAGLYLLYINIKCGGNWFLPFAMPVCAFMALIVSSVAILIYYLRAGYLYIFGGAFILGSVFFIVTEALLNASFFPGRALLWSPYPCAAFFLIGISLIVIAIVKPFRESLYKIFSF